MMPKITIEPPSEAGVVRIGVFAPDGQLLVHPRLVLPPTGAFEFDAPKPGTYTASLESLGAGQVLWSFSVASDTSTLKVPPLDSLRVQRPERAGARNRSGGSNTAVPGEIAAIELWADHHPETLPNILPTDAVAFERRLDVGNVSAGPTMSFNPGPGVAYSLGLSYDSQPLRSGGWRPFTARTVNTRRTDSGDVEVEFDRDDTLPPANSGARLRLSIAIEANRVQRVLVPLFAGGVRVRLRTAEAPYLSSDTLSIVPSRPETHALLQALTSNSMEIATGIWNEIGHGPAHLARYASADVGDDPWVSVAVGVLMLRLGWLRDNDYWLEELARHHRWLADASILAAHQRLAQNPPDVDGAIGYLQQARRAGAVYFFEANRLQGDLLVALAADGPEKTHRNLAAAELARWRTELANQVQVGAFFSWLMTRGARTRGGLDQRYSTILDSGRLAGQTR
ncbi:hypothetical protein J2R76_004004 [Bradyrhizobium sp. USDA 4532]|uniref:hypothetical protein n=1 Tax=unclassified Bradyrhizobium TaxID=2631580 RepID=UPI00209C7A21|nr:MULTISPECIES: hypothetical protein [unclassified Bradyrhizobium]MCP1835664.1 hypothetical protein [Bradyrhizobium sp. USDA 4545]MCP1920413.1 hypothetical protein [Bradyrhizobium sp. USDA 4532]